MARVGKSHPPGAPDDRIEVPIVTRKSLRSIEPLGSVAGVRTLHRDEPELVAR